MALEDFPKNGDFKYMYNKPRKRKIRYVFRICTKCNIGQWIQYGGSHVNAQGLCKKCVFKNRIGNNNGSWKGGRRDNGRGYIEVCVLPTDPYYSMHIRDRSYVLEHRLKMARHIGRCLKPWEVVHHKNGVRNDNRLRNLELLKCRKDHASSMMMQCYIKKLEKENIKLKEQNKILRRKLSH